MLVGLLALLALGWYLSFTATRLDRMHARVEGSRHALETQLVRRASVALELATLGVLDPASSLLLAGAAADARDAEPTDREAAESDLTRALHLALAETPDAMELRDELADACHRVQLARRFHNDAVRAARSLRGKRIVRWLRLAGRAPWPRTFEMSDTPPPGLTRAATESRTVDP